MNAGSEVFKTISKRIGQFLNCSGSCLLNMVSADTDGVEFWHILRSIFKNIGNDAHGGLRWINIGIANHKFFQNIVLNGS